MPTLTPQQVFQSPVMPVIVIHDLNDAIPMAEALLNGGITALEVTLRTPVALDAVEKIAKALPDVMIGVGTVINTKQYDASVERGAQFAISPGASLNLLNHCKNGAIPFIPGTATPSEMMTALELGFDHLKFFPAEANGGTKTLSAISAALPQIKFCPTGGINIINVADYLKLPCVATVGGSWMLPNDAVKAKDWNKITELSRQAVEFIQQCCK